MGAKVMEMAGTKEQETEQPAPSRVSAFAEDRAAKYLLSGVNESGQRVWFYRVHVTGLQTRIFGPFVRKSHAIDGFDAFLNGTLHAFCDCLNDATREDKRAMECIQLPTYMGKKSR